MDIKVGQFCRYSFDSIWRKDTRISKIKEIDDGVLFEDGTYILDNNPINYKTADNLEDLLELKDIITFVNLQINHSVEYIIQKLSDIEFLKVWIKQGTVKITAIELHENRVKQTIGGI